MHFLGFITNFSCCLNKQERIESSQVILSIAESNGLHLVNYFYENVIEAVAVFVPLDTCPVAVLTDNKYLQIQIP